MTEGDTEYYEIHDELGIEVAFLGELASELRYGGPDVVVRHACLASDQSRLVEILWDEVTIWQEGDQLISYPSFDPIPDPAVPVQGQQASAWEADIRF